MTRSIKRKKKKDRSDRLITFPSSKQTLYNVHKWYVNVLGARALFACFYDRFTRLLCDAHDTHQGFGTLLQEG